MVMQIKSYGDLDSLKEDDFVFSPTLTCEGKKWTCILEKYKIKSFLAKSVSIEPNSKIHFDKFDATLERLDDNAEMTTNLRRGFCTDSNDAKKQILALFKEELENMTSAIEEQMKTLN